MSPPLVNCRDIFKAYYGKALKASQRNQSGLFNVYGSSGTVGHHDNTLTEKSTIIIGRKGSVGKVTYAPEGGWTIDTAYYVELLDQKACDLRYLYYALKNSRLSSLTITTSIPGLNRDDLYSVKIPLPPLEEQKRIVVILDKSDAIRHKRKQAIDLTDQLLRSVFLDMFGDPVTNPKGFEIKPLSQLCDVRDGTHDSPKYVSEGYPLITSKNLRTGSIDLCDVNYISEKDYLDINKRSKVEIHDLLMPMIGTIGNPVGVDFQPEFAIKNVALIRASDAKIDMAYILYLLRSHYFKFVTSKKNRGGTQKFISLSDIRSFPVPIPANNLLEEFTEFVGKLNRGKSNQIKQSEKIEMNFNSLTQRAFRGKLTKQTKAA